MSLITASICLSDIPKECITTSEKNGKKYLSIVIASRQQPDKYDNTHTIYVNQSKEEREQGKVKQYIGNGKEKIFNDNGGANTGQQSQTAGNYNPTPIDDPNSDLPFLHRKITIQS